MANKGKIFLLSKYQMRVLYYKCNEGLTHPEIAEKLDRSDKTVQAHMTNIYTILEIKKPGKSKYDMDSELKNEICPIIRKLFISYDDVKFWAPMKNATLEEILEVFAVKLDEQELVELLSPYKPPSSVEKFLPNSEDQSKSFKIFEPPPQGKHRINWRLIIRAGIVIGLLAVTSTIFYPNLFELFIRLSKRTKIDPIDGMVLVYIHPGKFQMGSDKSLDLDAGLDEIPQHTVKLDPYWIDQTEVTNAQYQLCVDAGVCDPPR